MINYYDEIKEKLLKNEIYAKVKDYSKERIKVLTYFEVGKLLSDAGKEYNVRTLRRIRQFYNIFSDTKWSPMVTKLTWSHIRELLPLKDENAISYYLNSAINLSLTQRELSEKIKSKEYERLGEKTN